MPPRSRSSCPHIRFELPEGNYLGILISIYELGTQTSERYKKDDEKVCLIFELPDAEATDNGPVTLSKIYTASLHEKAALRATVEALLARTLSDAKATEGIDLQQLLGANASLYVVKTENSGRVRMNIRTITPITRGMKKAKSYNEHVFYEIDPRQDIPKDTPEWLATLIKKSKEWTSPIDEEEYPVDAEDELPFESPVEETVKEPF